MCCQLVTLNGVHPNRTHQRLQQPPNGFEDRPEHQSRLPSAFHCSGMAGDGTDGIRGCCGKGEQTGTLEEQSLRLANPRSSNGRTAAFGAVNRGSNPCRGAILKLAVFRPAHRFIPSASLSRKCQHIKWLAILRSQHTGLPPRRSHPTSPPWLATSPLS